MENNETTGFAGQAAEKATQFAGQAKDLLSKVDTEKAMGATSKFMAGVFKFGKIVSALFMLLCIATMVLSLLYALFKGSESLKVPQFKDVVAAVESDGGGQNSDAAKLARKQEYRKVRDRYSKQIDTIVDLYRLDAKDATDLLVQSLCDEVPEKFRDTFVKGAIAFGKDARKHYAKKGDGTQIDGDDADLYRFLFNAAVEQAEESDAEARMNRQAAWTVCGGAFLGLILFLFLPLLIQIEENTRK